MYSSIILGLLAIYAGGVQLGAHWSVTVLWIGVIVYGVVKILEGFPRLLKALKN